MTHPFDDGCRRRGVVAVVVRQGRFLVIRRAAAVVAPGMICFPGGEGEAETEEETLVREIREELGVAIEPIRRVWRSVTPRQVELSWWLSRIAEGSCCGRTRRKSPRSTGRRPENCAGCRTCSRATIIFSTPWMRGKSSSVEGYVGNDRPRAIRRRAPPLGVNAGRPFGSD